MCTIWRLGRSGRWRFQHSNVLTWGLFGTRNFRHHGHFGTGCPPARTSAGPNSTRAEMFPWWNIRAEMTLAEMVGSLPPCPILLAKLKIHLRFSHLYSRVHISSDEVFSKILNKPFIVQKKMIPHMKAFGLFNKIKPKKKNSEKKNHNGRLKKRSSSSSANSQYFFVKILWIGPWVSRIDWCKGHWRGSIYMVVRLSGISPKTA